MYEILRGSAVKIMNKMPDKCFDCIVTDPPWGIGIDYGVYQDTADDLITMIRKVVPEMQRVADRVIIMCGTKHMHYYPRPTWTLAWVYPAGGGGCSWGFTCWQPIICYGKDPYLQHRMGGRPDVFTKIAPVYNNITRHPTPKPIPFMLKLIERVSVKQTDSILGPFCGSGSTGVAAVKLGRRFLGIDINPHYVKIAERHIMEHANDNNKETK